MRVYTTVRYLAFKHKAVQRPFTGFSNVPIADDYNLEDQTFVATNWKVKAAVQIAGSISLICRTPVQRLQT